jgi:hypothetical protein
VAQLAPLSAPSTAAAIKAAANRPFKSWKVWKRPEDKVFGAQAVPKDVQK